MILFPAIDLKDGQCVRLKHGEMSAATVFNDDPAAQARTFQDQGFTYLHIVDLNGAFAGKPVNGAAVEGILKALNIPAQLGGGIRDLATIEAWLTKGIRRVILGTAAVRDPGLVHEACRMFPGRVAVGIDAKGKVASPRLGQDASLNSAIERRSASRTQMWRPSSLRTSNATKARAEAQSRSDDGIAFPPQGP